MEDFVSFEIAKKLKEKGYPQHITEGAYIPLVPDYMDDIAAPTISQVLKWLRKEKRIHIGVLYHNYYAVWIQPMKRNESEHVIHDCKTHEGAALAGIEYVLDNLI